MSQVSDAGSDGENVSGEAVGIASGSYRYPFLRAFSYPLFRRLLAAQVMFGFANWMNRLAVGFLVLDQTGSTFLTALSFAAQTAPGLVVAPIAGTISDRVDRRYLLAAAAVMKAVVLVLLGLLFIGGVGAIWPVIALVAVGGIFTSFEMPSSPALVTDIVERRDAAHCRALPVTAARSVGVRGALVGVMIGTGIACRLPVEMLRKIFAVVLIIVAVRMFIGPSKSQKAMAGENLKDQNNVSVVETGGTSKDPGK